MHCVKIQVHIWWLLSAKLILNSMLTKFFKRPKLSVIQYLLHLYESFWNVSLSPGCFHDGTQIKHIMSAGYVNRVTKRDAVIYQKNGFDYREIVESFLPWIVLKYNSKIYDDTINW